MFTYKREQYTYGVGFLITHKQTRLLGMGTFISQIRHCAQVLVPATVYSCLAAVFDIFEIGSLQ